MPEGVPVDGSARAELQRIVAASINKFCTGPMPEDPDEDLFFSGILDSLSFLEIVEDLNVALGIDLFERVESTESLRSVAQISALVWDVRHGSDHTIS